MPIDQETGYWRITIRPYSSFTNIIRVDHRNGVIIRRGKLKTTGERRNQAALFDKSIFQTREAARKWLYRNPMIRRQ